MTGMRGVELLAAVALVTGCGSDDAGSSSTAKEGDSCSREAACGGQSLTCRFVAASATAEATCQPEASTGSAAGAECSSTADCRTGVCHFGVCSDLCGQTGDCGSGNVCEEISVIEGGAQILSACPDLSSLPRAKLCQPERARLVRDLGSVADGKVIVLDFPEGAASFSLVGRTEGAEPVGFGRLEAPDGEEIFLSTDDPAQMLKNDVWFYPDAFVSTLQVPTTPDHSLARGPFCASVKSGGPLQVEAIVKRDQGGDVPHGKLSLNIYLTGLEAAGCGLAGITAATASSHAVLSDALESARTIFEGAAIELGELSYHDRTTIPAIATLTTSDPSTFDPVFALATESQGFSVDVFVVKTIPDGAGFAGHMPGPPGKHGLPRSGVVVSADTACTKTLGVTIAHEVSHLLGLFHNYQPDPGFEDPIADSSSGKENLMYITATPESTQISPGQGFVLRRHPNVGW